MSVSRALALGWVRGTAHLRPRGGCGRPARSGSPAMPYGRVMSSALAPAGAEEANGVITVLPWAQWWLLGADLRPADACTAATTTHAKPHTPCRQQDGRERVTTTHHRLCGRTCTLSGGVSDLAWLKSPWASRPHF